MNWKNRQLQQMLCTQFLTRVFCERRFVNESLKPIRRALLACHALSFAYGDGGSAATSGGRKS